jgi:hypothetical protein
VFCILPRCLFCFGKYRPQRPDRRRCSLVIARQRRCWASPRRGRSCGVFARCSRGFPGLPRGAEGFGYLARPSLFIVLRIAVTSNILSSLEFANSMMTSLMVLSIMSSLRVRWSTLQIWILGKRMDWRLGHSRSTR